MKGFTAIRAFNFAIEGMGAKEIEDKDGSD